MLRKLEEVKPGAIVDDVKRTGVHWDCGVCGKSEGMEDCVRVTYIPGGDLYVHATDECYKAAISERKASFWAKMAAGG